MSKRRVLTDTPPTTREEIANLFWISGAAERLFSRGCGNMQLVAWRPPLRLEDFRRWVDGDNERLPETYEYVFRLERFAFGDEFWWAVSCQNMLVVAPFLDPDKAGTPWPQFPEDIERV